MPDPFYGLIMKRRVKVNGVDDPLASAISPPENETAAAREARLQAEAGALRISKEIDAKIEEENRVQGWRNNAVEVVLLGPTDSGKKTLLKSI